METARLIVGTILQAVLLFGSRAGGVVRADSDADILVLIEPPPRTWTPTENIDLRRRLDARFLTFPAPVDCWVRTTDQFSAARHVVEGVEHWADTRGIVLYERPMTRTPHSVRTIRELTLVNVADWMRGARGQLARAVQLASGAPARQPTGRPVHPPQHYCTRAIQRALGALFVLNGEEPRPKSASILEIVHVLACIEPALAESCRGVVSAVVTLEMARLTIELAARRLMLEPELAGTMGALLRDVTS